MEASAGLVAGSHNRNELVVIRRDGESGPKPLKQLTGQKCQICGDDVGVTVDGELFVACNECAFPVCRTCYEYERQEGSQICPQCKTRFKRLKGCARVEGDEEEDDIDDVENEFNFEGRVRDSAKLLDSRQHSLARSEAMLHGHGGWHMSYGHIFDSSELHPHVFHNTNNSNTLPQLPLLTNGHMVDDDIPPEQHALVPSTVGVGGGSSSTRIHPLPFSDPSLPVQSRSMDPSKDLAAYGYGSVAWKERMESWKHKQEKQHLMKHENHGNNDWDDDGDGMDLPL